MENKKLKIGKAYLVDTEPRRDNPEACEEMTFLYETPHSVVFKRKDGSLYALSKKRRKYNGK